MSKKVLITGGAGFIGSNLADRLIRSGDKVTVLDNLSRRGTEKNLKWLEENHSGKFQFINGDIRNHETCLSACKGMEVIYHLAGQVAVTTSVEKPRDDFDINLLGTFNMLEGARNSGNDPLFLFTSTNKVYGGMEDAMIIENNNRYEYRDLPDGVSEERILDFHSPYGCSKGGADQYVRDYSRIYGIRSVVFRMSCIYGRRQFGNEDQGWVAHFIISSSFGRPLTIYGDGKQIRDILFVDDLVRAFSLAVKNINKTVGNIYNIGGGADNTLSLLELVSMIENKLGKKINPALSEWRPGDQQVYVSNSAKAYADFQWKPEIDAKKGIELLFEWVESNKQLFDI